MRPNDPDVEPVCLGCGNSFTVDVGCENDGWCHPCAHAAIDEARGWLESYIPGPGTSVAEMVREWRRLCKALRVDIKNGT